MNLFANTAYASVDSVIANVSNLIINPLITFMFAVAVVYFLYGVLGFFLNSEDEEARTTGKSHMFWGVVGITIMISVWGILKIVTNSIGVSNQIKINTQQNSGQVEVKLNDFTPPPFKK
jgi:hypothetical protein